MKKIIIVLLSTFLFVLLASCNSSNPTPPVNTINIASLTAEEQSILNLFSIPNNQELMIFDFNADGSFRSVEIWVEVYKSGELIDRPAGLVTINDSGNTQNGRLAVIINQNENAYQWTLSIVENGGKASHIGTAEIVIDSGFGRAFGPINDPVIIEDGKEIIIYSSTFQPSGVPHHAYDGQTLQERPELLLEYPYVHLIKAIFSK